LKISSVYVPTQSETRNLAIGAGALKIIHLCYVLGRGYIEARTDTTQQSGQTSDKEVEIKNITIYVTSYTEIDRTGVLSPPTVWRFSVADDINSNFNVQGSLQNINL